MMRVPVSLILIALIAFGCSPEGESENASNQSANIETPIIHQHFGWLQGTWVRRTTGGTSYEQWQADDSGLTGLAFQVELNDTTVVERLWLIDEGSSTYYVAHPHQNPEPVRFTMSERDSLTTTFENPEHDFPTRITYFNKPPDSMVVSIEGPTAEGTHTIDFAFGRLE